MARHTCVVCSVFDASMGMQAHPVFNDDALWEQHQYESHGAPKPKGTEKPPKVKEPAKEPAKESKPAKEPKKKPDMPGPADMFPTVPERLRPSTWTPGDQAALNREYMNRLDALHDRAELFASQLSTMESENAGLHKSIQDLEAQIGGQAAINDELRRRLEQLESVATRDSRNQ